MWAAVQLDGIAPAQWKPLNRTLAGMGKRLRSGGVQFELELLIDLSAFLTAVKAETSAQVDLV